MSPQCLPPSFGPIQLTIREQMRFEDFQDGGRGNHLRYRNKMLLAILNLHVTLIPSIDSIQFTIQEQMWFEDFQDGGHLGYWNRMILAILNLYVAPMPPIKFLLNPTYGWEISFE